MKSSYNNFFYTILSRKKTFGDEPEKEKLNRVLNIFDLTSMGIGCTLGCGIYVMAGNVARSYAGPAVVLSFVIAAVVSSLSGLCYAEFAGRVPRAGSAYIYSYVTIGELIAFIIGWTLYIEHSIGTAAAAKAVCDYLDSLMGHPQRTYMKNNFPMNMGFLGEYPDAAAFSLVISVALVVAWGVRKSSNVNTMFTLFNLLTVGTIIVSGIYFADFSNWSIPKNKIPRGVNGGNGGFIPFGWTGVVVGAARCFYAYVGFDSMATTGDETKNPKRTIPVAIVLTLFLATLAYCGVASVLTLMWPYYDQDPNSPLPVIYENFGMPIIKYIVSCGTVSALVSTLIGCMFPVPRILYSMANDGLLFNFLSKVNESTKTPFVATLICGFGSGILSSIFNLDQLIDMMSIGTLLTYVIISICILILRYKDNNHIDGQDSSGFGLINIWLNIFISNPKITNKDTQHVSRVLLSVFTVTAFVFCICLVNIDSYESSFHFPLTIIVGISFGTLVIVTMMLCRLPQAIESLSFKVPFVPFIPCLSIVLNLYMMMELNFKTWIRFIVGIVIGLLIYMFYGIRYSLEGIKQRELRNEKEKNKL